MRIASDEAVFRLSRRVNQLGDFVCEKSFAAFESDRCLQLAVEHLYWLTGKTFETLLRQNDEVSQRANALVARSGFNLDYSDRLVTEYENVDIRDVWKSVQGFLPILKQQINAWADELGMEPPPGQTR